MSTIALIIGTGSRLSASLARLFAKEGFTIALAARRTDKLNALSEEIGVLKFAVLLAIHIAYLANWEKFVQKSA